MFAHFGSREELQLSVLEWTVQRFTETVVRPAFAQPRGLPRLRGIVFGWFNWVLTNEEGCVILAAAGEYDGRPGVMRDRVVGWLTEWHVQLAKAVAFASNAASWPRKATGSAGVRVGGAYLPTALHAHARPGPRRSHGVAVLRTHHQVLSP